MNPISEVYGNQWNLIEKVINNASFNIHVCLPAVVQSYDPIKQTIEAQPTVRERVIQENGEITYLKYPLLINVPVAFPQASGYSITFPVKKGDECLIVFSDVSIDNWWLKGNIQNPVEQRRHDLSDGIAILGLINQDKLKNKNKKPNSNSLVIQNDKYGTGITVGEQNGTVTCRVERTNDFGEKYYTIETRTFSQLMGFDT